MYQCRDIQVVNKKNGNTNKMSRSALLDCNVHPGWHGYNVAWSQQGSGTVLQEYGNILPQGSPPIHVCFMEEETFVSGTTPNIPANALWDHGAAIRMAMEDG